jgi:transcriptional regulator GlxA family with amidase domain
MNHISIIVPKGNAITGTIVAPYNLLNMANSYYKKVSGQDENCFIIDLVGLDKEPVLYQSLFQITPTKTIDEINKTSLIIVSAFTGTNLEKDIEINSGFVSWIKKQRFENGSDIACLCTGAFLLAETGLLNDKACSTHWMTQDHFKLRYPSVILRPEKIICEDNGIMSSGGVYYFITLMLYIIEKYYGRETAIWCSKSSGIEFDLINQNQFMIFNGQKEHDDHSIKQAQLYIENNFEGKLNVDEIANIVKMSSRSFLRRFKKATSNTPHEYIQRVKIEAAKKSLESTNFNVQQVMYNVGYIDEKSFRNTFKKYTGLSPLDYRNKYNHKIIIIKNYQMP